MSRGLVTVLLVAPVTALAVLVGRRGGLGALAQVQLRGRAWIAVAAAVQALRSTSPSWAATVLEARGGVLPVVVLTLCGCAFLGANAARATSAVRVALAAVAAGALANAVPALLNGGMPFSVAAARTAGISERAIAAPAPGHVALTEATRLAALSDVVPVPGLGIVLSIGDVLLWAGLAGLLIVSAQAVLALPGRPAGAHHPVGPVPVGPPAERTPS